jgi:hypothetical protein
MWNSNLFSQCMERVCNFDRVHHLQSSTGSTTVDNVIVGVHSNVEFGVESLNFSGPEGSERCCCHLAELGKGERENKGAGPP